jgi:hypothetical protein
MPDHPSKTRWEADNVTRVTLKLNHNTDSDILEALQGKQKQTELKRLLRIALQGEKKK